MDDLNQRKSSTEDQQHYSFQKHLTTSIIILIVKSLVGNTFVVCHIAINPRLRKKHLLFLNLSVADLLATLANHLPTVIFITSESSWMAGNVFCKILMFAMFLVRAGTMYAILIITANQFTKLINPPCSYFSTKVSILGSWLISLLPALPYLYTAGEIDIKSDLKVCHFLANVNSEVEFSTYLIILSIRLAFIFYLPLLSGAILFALIFLKAKPWRWLQAPSKKSKIFFLSLTLYTISLFTSIPFLIEHNIFLFSEFQHSTPRIDDWMYFIVLISSAVNPYIYILFHLNEGFCGRTSSRTDSEALDTTYDKNLASSATQPTQETTV